MEGAFMKKFVAVVLAALLALSFFGCAEETTDSSNNTMFPDSCFVELKQISLLGMTHALSGEEMQPVIDILQSLTLTPIAEGEYVKENVDAVLLIPEYENGEISTFQISDTVLCSTEVDAIKHSTSDQFFDNFIKAFGVAED